MAPPVTETRCIILEDNRIVGAIGGGLMEHLVIQKAEAVFETKKSAMMHLTFTGKDVLKSAMIRKGNGTGLMRH